MRFRKWLGATAACVLGLAVALSGPLPAYADEADLASELTEMSGVEIVAPEDDSSEVATRSVPAESRTSSVTGVTIGKGFHAVTKLNVNQRDVYSKALSGVIKWRQNALNDRNVKILYQGSWYTVGDCLSKMGMSVGEYLSPQWSNALERIAVQRAVEEGDFHLHHQRPDGTDCFTATYNGVQTTNEILAWGESDISGAIEDWAAEKNDYIKYVNGQDYDEYGHYLALIDPQNRSYGFAQAPSNTMFGTVFSGEANSAVYQDKSSTGLSGSYTFDVSLDLSWLGTTLGHTMTDDGLLVGRADLAYHIWPSYMNYMYELVGTVSVSDTSLVQVLPGNVLRPLRAGTVSIIFADDAGWQLAIDVPVRYFSDTSTSTYHIDDINWLREAGITTGFSNGDGTYSYQPMSAVARCDMAAFLYRLAGSPAYNAPSKSPFPDVDSSTPHYKEICWLADKRISTGFADGTFRPYATVVRQDMAAFLYRLAGSPSYSAPSTSPFTDVTTATSHYKEICWLANSGVSAGFPDKTFRGMNSVVRCDMAAFLRRMSDKRLV